MIFRLNRIDGALKSGENEAAPSPPFPTFVSFCSHFLRSLCLRASVSLCHSFGSSRPYPCCLCISSLILMATSAGCGLFRPPGTGPLQNPMFIPAIDRELLWNQTVDSVDDYFRIEREDRVRVIGGVVTEG